MFGNFSLYRKIALALAFVTLYAFNADELFKKKMTGLFRRLRCLVVNKYAPLPVGLSFINNPKFASFSIFLVWYDFFCIVF